MRLRGWLSTSTTACMFGLGVVLAKLIAGVLNQFLITFLALLGGGLLIALYLLTRRQALLPPLSQSAWKYLLQLAFLGTALPTLLGITGLAHMNVIAAGVLLQMQGPASVLFATLLLQERLTWWQGTGMALLLLGGILVVLQTGQVLAWQGSGMGVVLVLAAALGYGFGPIPAKQLAGQADTLQLSALRLLLGACFVAPLLFFQSSLMQGTISWSVSGILLLYIITNYCIGYITQQAGLRFLKAWEAAAILQAAPLFTTIFALILLHETLTLMQVGGGMLVLVGGVIVALGESTIEGSAGERS